MLISIGRTAMQERGVVNLFVDCHERIRRFIGLAEAVGLRDDLADAEVVDACVDFERYFTDALPLHVQDEEDSLLPRLRGLQPELDAELLELHRQHLAHEPMIASLLEASLSVRTDPPNRIQRQRLASVATTLAADFGSHLAREEAILFPAVRNLISAAEQADIAAEVRARRQAPR